MPPCPRCHGAMFPTGDGDLRCLLCGEPQLGQTDMATPSSAQAAQIRDERPVREPSVAPEALQVSSCSGYAWELRARLAS
jgi:hypothetical protein